MMRRATNLKFTLTTMSRYFSTSNAPNKYIQRSSLYERKPVTELWNRLTLVTKQQWKWMNVADKEDHCWLNVQTRILQIYGPPGCGKSTATFRWMHDACRTCRTQALWIRCSPGNDACWRINGSSGTVEINAFAIPQAAQDANGIPIVAFDGIRSAFLENWVGLMISMSELGIAVYAVSSEGVRFNDGESQHVLKLSHFMPSWTMEEYLAATSSNEFWESNWQRFYDGTRGDPKDRRRELIECKFPVAGHCARFMFGYPEVFIKQKLKADAEAMGGIDSLEKAVRNTRSAGAVNSLVARLQASKNGVTRHEQAAILDVEDLENTAISEEDLVLLDEEVDETNARSCLVSKVAANEVVKNLPSSIHRLRALARSLDNRVIEGYAFEQQVKKSLEEAANPGRSLELEKQDGQTEQLQVDVVINCTKEELSTILKQESSRRPNTWVFVAGQQGAFDAIHLVSTTMVRFVQATVGRKQSFYLDIVQGLLVSLALSNITWTHVEFLVLRPADEKHLEFRLDPARGRIDPSYHRFDGAQWGRTDSRHNVIYKFLSWSQDS